MWRTTEGNLGEEALNEKELSMAAVPDVPRTAHGAINAVVVSRWNCSLVHWLPALLLVKRSCLDGAPWSRVALKLL